MPIIVSSLETERGYSTQIMSPGIDLRHSIIWPARACMVTPTSGGIRVGGTVEMAGPDAPPDVPAFSSSVRSKRCPRFRPGTRRSGWVTGRRPPVNLTPYRVDRF
jgi:D-amino-acid dehydrogenase